MKYFAFQTPWGKYELTRLPQGSKNSAQFFQQCINEAFEGLLGVNIQCFLDDIIVFSENMTDNMARYSRR